MKLMSPWACRVTFFERWRATAGNPMLSNSRRSMFRIRRGVFDELESVGAHGLAVFMSPPEFDALFHHESRQLAEAVQQPVDILL
jgi:hypothetical protein